MYSFKDQYHFIFGYNLIILIQVNMKSVFHNKNVYDNKHFCCNKCNNLLSINKILLIILLILIICVILQNTSQTLPQDT